MLHLIPDDGRPHAPTTECGCGPHAEMVPGADGRKRVAIVHPAAEELDGDDSAVWESDPDA